MSAEASGRVRRMSAKAQEASKDEPLSSPERSAKHVPAQQPRVPVEITAALKGARTEAAPLNDVDKKSAPLARPVSSAPPPAKAAAAADSSHPNNLNLDLSGGHRVSCHRCGNMRKKNVLCNRCPHIFCQRCAEKLVQEWGEDVFDVGCVVCKQMCCCADPRDAQSCPRLLHCYKKCVAEFKNNPTAASAAGAKPAKEPLLDVPTSVAIVQQLLDREPGREGHGPGGAAPTGGPASFAKASPRPSAASGPGKSAQPRQPQSSALKPPAQRPGAPTSEVGDDEEASGQYEGASSSLPTIHEVGQARAPTPGPGLKVKAPRLAGDDAMDDGQEGMQPLQYMSQGHSRKRSAEMSGLLSSSSRGAPVARMEDEGMDHSSRDSQGQGQAKGMPNLMPSPSPSMSDTGPEGQEHSSRPAVLVGGSGGSGLAMPGLHGLPFPLMSVLPTASPGPGVPGLPNPGDPLSSIASPGLRLGLAAGVAAGLSLAHAAAAQHAPDGFTPLGQPGGTDGLSVPSSLLAQGGLPLPSFGLGLGLGLGGLTPLPSALGGVPGQLGQPHAESFKADKPPIVLPPLPTFGTLPPPPVYPSRQMAGQSSSEGSQAGASGAGHDGSALTSLSPGMHQGISGMGLGGAKAGMAGSGPGSSWPHTLSAQPHGQAAPPPQDSHDAVLADLTPLGTAGQVGFAPTAM